MLANQERLRRCLTRTGSTEVNLPRDLCGSVVLTPTRSLDRCQPHFSDLDNERAVSLLDIFRITLG